jgi:maleate cis-trans isomerase
MSTKEVTWEWLKTAPLPVVLSLCLTSFMVLGSYAWSIDNEVKEQKAVVAVAAEKAKVAAEVAIKIEEKLDKVLELVSHIAIEQAVAKSKAEEAKKKEKK